MACHTQEEIAEAVGIAEGTLKGKLTKEVWIEWLDSDTCPKSTKLLATYQDCKSGVTQT